jgi:hypothetical protein
MSFDATPLTDAWLEAGRRTMELTEEALAFVRRRRKVLARAQAVRRGEAALSPGEGAELSGQLDQILADQARLALEVPAAIRGFGAASGRAKVAWASGAEPPPDPTPGLRAVARFDQLQAALEATLEE